MAKIVILMVCLGVLVLLIKNKFTYGKKEEKAIDTTNMVKDPVCNTYIDENSEYKVKYYEKIYHFCSQECMDKFKEQKKAEHS